MYLSQFYTNEACFEFIRMVSSASTNTTPAQHQSLSVDGMSGSDSKAENADSRTHTSSQSDSKSESKSDRGDRGDSKSESKALDGGVDYTNAAAAGADGVFEESLAATDRDTLMEFR